MKNQKILPSKSSVSQYKFKARKSLSANNLFPTGDTTATVTISSTHISGF